MGRGRGKGKKQCAIAIAIAIAARDDTGSGDDEKLPVKRRGRPQKPIQDDIDEVDKVEEEGEETKSSVLSESNKNEAAADENGRKRKMPESDDSVTEENGIAAKANPTVLIKTVSYRKIGSRRKSINPCRAPDR